jgi:large repetitive protein
MIRTTGKGEFTYRPASQIREGPGLDRKELGTQFLHLDEQTPTEERPMKKNQSIITTRILAALFTLAALTMTFSAPAFAAGTSGGATIYNTVKVNYTSGTSTLFATANVSVTVSTVAAIPAVTNPPNQTVIAGGTATYNYVVKSNSNGPDTYTTSALANTPTGVAAATGTSVTASVALWGGIALGSGAGNITVPFGTAPAVSTTVQIGANQYTVTAVAAGTAASTDGSGNLVAEVPATLTLAPIGAAPAITAGLISNGTQVGEFKAVSLTAALTAGAPTATGTDGTYATHFTISSTVTPAVNVVTTDVTTTVSSPKVEITKTADKASAAPGDTITYTITVTNTHLTASVSSVTVIDPVPAYTTYVSNSTRLNGITVAGDGATSPLVAGLLVDSNNGRAAGAAATGTLPALGIATITFQVKVQ